MARPVNHTRLADLSADIRAQLALGVNSVSQLANTLARHRTTIADRLREMETYGLVHCVPAAGPYIGPAQWLLGPKLGADGKPVRKFDPMPVPGAEPKQQTFDPVGGRDFFVAALFGAPRSANELFLGAA